MLLSWDCIIKIFFLNLLVTYYLTADPMSLVSPPSSNGWTIPLKRTNTISRYRNWNLKSTDFIGRYNRKIKSVSLDRPIRHFAHHWEYVPACLHMLKSCTITSSITVLCVCVCTIMTWLIGTNFYKFLEPEVTKSPLVPSPIPIPRLFCIAIAKIFAKMNFFCENVVLRNFVYVDENKTKPFRFNPTYISELFVYLATNFAVR
jgi:hypothetical protein